MTAQLCSPSGAAATEYQRLSSLDNRNVLSPLCRLKVQAQNVSGVDASWGSWRRIGSRSLGAAGVLAISAFSSLWNHSPSLCLHLRMAFSLCRSASTFPIFTRAQVRWNRGPACFSRTPFLTNDICSDLISKSGHIPRRCGLGLHHLTIGEHS